MARKCQRRSGPLHPRVAAADHRRRSVESVRPPKIAARGAAVSAAPLGARGFEKGSSHAVTVCPNCGRRQSHQRPALSDGNGNIDHTYCRKLSPGGEESSRPASADSVLTQPARVESYDDTFESSNIEAKMLQTSKDHEDKSGQVSSALPPEAWASMCQVGPPCLRSEKMELESRINGLQTRRDQLLAVNARLREAPMYNCPIPLVSHASAAEVNAAAAMSVCTRTNLPTSAGSSMDKLPGAPLGFPLGFPSSAQPVTDYQPHQGNELSTTSQHSFPECPVMGHPGGVSSAENSSHRGSTLSTSRQSCNN
ncbi:hypothetical protein HPB51_029226 [Rhipicephalus microplus]|uniref:Uncharacterized protein n=1 Tax=Rhipicephalus microplus TaxID=6941 RepID=A0A9J6CV85_RHIMP|nr:hypothetical protein HPB51_029226 [Rhipicephalus microplus]